jgi:cohesin complex subunit SA-1/2
VGKLSNKKMEPAMVGFVKEGMRYAFSCPKKGADDDQDLFGDRLSFLGPLKMYLNWVKKNPAQKAEVLAEYQERSAEFKRHLFFDEEAHAEILKVFGDDFEAVLKSRKVVEIEEEEELLEEPVSQKRKSTGNQSVSSASKGSSNLESVKESDEESPEHVPGVFDESDGKRRRSTRAQ